MNPEISQTTPEVDVIHDNTRVPDLDRKIFEDKPTRKNFIKDVFEELVSGNKTGEHKTFLELEVPDSEPQATELLRKKAKYIIRLIIGLKYYELYEKVEEIEKKYFNGKLKDAILWEMTRSWGPNIAEKYRQPTLNSYDNKMKEAENFDASPSSAKSEKKRRQLDSAGIYLQAASHAYHVLKDFNKFEIALKKAAEVRTKTNDKKQIHGYELTLLAANARLVFDVLIPSVKEFNMERDKERVVEKEAKAVKRAAKKVVPQIEPHLL